jgi:hypothetical protein
MVEKHPSGGAVFVVLFSQHRFLVDTAFFLCGPEALGAHQQLESVLPKKNHEHCKRVGGAESL